MVLYGATALVLVATVLVYKYAWVAKVLISHPAKQEDTSRRDGPSFQEEQSIRAQHASEQKSLTGQVNLPEGEPTSKESKAPRWTATKAEAQPSINLQSDISIPSLSPAEKLPSLRHDSRSGKVAPTSISSQPRPSPAQPQQSLTSPSFRLPASRQSQSASLMPPPSVKPASLRPLPKLGSSLAPPPSAASLARGGPARGPQQAPQLGGALAASTSTLPPSARPSRKVILEPGHSPLDWANLLRDPPTPGYLRGEGLPPQLLRVTPAQLKQMHGRKGRDGWGTYQGKVYNLNPYLKFHPGGVGELMRGAGKVGEAERLFFEVHPWVNWDSLLGDCLVGILVSDSEAASTTENDLEAMD